MRIASTGRRWGGIAVLIMIVALLAAVHTTYPLPYIMRVMIDQDADPDDLGDFPATRIAAADTPWQLVVAPDPLVRVALTAHPEIGDVDTWLAATETAALLVLRGDTLLFEHYAPGQDASSPQNSWSVSKSVGSALVGLAVADGVVALDDPVTTHLPELAARDSAFAAITVGHLLDMQSGIAFTTKVGFPFVNADNPLIYYHPDLSRVVLEMTRIAGPPGRFRYNNYNPPLLGLILRRATGSSPSALLERHIWQPMGAGQPAGWQTDSKGVERMESGFFAAARDLARFGLLVLRSGEGILTPEWITRTTQEDAPLEVEEHNGRAWGYRGGWWSIPRPTEPADFSAIGRFGQFIYISPQYGVVIVRTGPGRGEWGDRDWTELFYELSAQVGGKR